MIVEVLNAIIVMYRLVAILVRNQLIYRTQSIFNNEQRLLVAIVERIQHVAQSLRIDLPAPLTCLEIRVWYAAQQVAFTSNFLLWITCLTDTHVVAE
ncbi:hypothetical protein D3C80_1707800 [compost metagenome]